MVKFLAFRSMRMKRSMHSVWLRSAVSMVWTRIQMAADLAKLSLWLATLAKDHPFTFLDHSLRNGDALVGLTRKQIASFHWVPAAQQTFF